MSADTQKSPGMCTLAMTLLYILVALPLGEGSIFQIDNTYPFISTNGVRVQWHSGAAAQWALSSLLVRIHPKGIMFKAQGWHMRDLARLGWTSVSCAPSAHGLCQSGESVFFPSSQDPEISETRSRECSSSKTNRVISNTSRYDTSACDVLDTQWDFVYTAEVMSRLDTSLPSWIYWSVCIIVIFLIRCLSRYILSSLRDTPGQKEHETPNPWVSVAVSSACTILIVSQGDTSFVTHEDLIFYWYTVFYIATYTCLFLGARATKRVYRIAIKDPPFYNLIAGVLQLVTSRLYSGAETPYNPAIVFIIAVRTITKSRRKVAFLRGVTLVLDACMLSLMTLLGFGPEPHYLVAISVGAMAWTDFLLKDTENI
jgi:hypothetical protein